MLSVAAALTLGRSSSLFPRWLNVRIEAPVGVVSNRLVLLWLLSRSGDMRLGAVAQMLDLTPRTVTGQVDALEHDGLVERRPSASDGRVVYVALTQKGSDLIRELEPELLAAFSSLFSCLEKPEMRELIRILEKLTDHMKEQIESPESN
jgi:DNA-binding MarR family transcriptional regulator